MRQKQDHLEYEFLPAALEIAETPPSPKGRLIIWIIFILLMTAILWSYLGEIDQVAVARGRIIPDGRLKVIQPLEEGIITSIHVTEGQRVKEGQLLIELDSTMKQVDIESLEVSVETAKLEKEILEKELRGEPLGDISAKINKDLVAGAIQTQKQLKDSREAEFKTRREALRLTVSQSEDQLNIAQSDLIKLQRTIEVLKDSEERLRKTFENKSVEESDLVKLEKAAEIMKQNEAALKRLYESGAIAQKEWETKNNELLLQQMDNETQRLRVKQAKENAEREWKNKQSELMLTEKELSTQRIKIQQARNRLEQAVRSLENLDYEQASKNLALIAEREKTITELNARLQKAKKSYQFQSLSSPVEGTVHGLSSNTVGGVVTPAQPVMTIVPDGTPLIVEANILNKDIGFIRVDQETEIKFDTFPFQKYGTVKGKITGISPDAFEDEKLGPLYKAKIQFAKAHFLVEGREVGIVPGMAATVEIKTGRRRVIEFFLDPLIKYAGESLKLR